MIIVLFQIFFYDIIYNIYMSGHSGIKSFGELVSKVCTVQNFPKIQFIAQFLIFSKYDENSHTFYEFLMAIQAIKVLLKVPQFYKHKNIYISHQMNQVNYVEENSLSQIKEKSEGYLESVKKIMKKIKNKDYMKVNYQDSVFQEFPNGKKIQLVTSVPVPKDLKRNKMSFWQIIAELLTILRPFLTIIGLRLFGIQSYKPYFLSLLIDMVIIFLQKDLKVLNKSQLTEIQLRRRQAISRYLFKKPVFFIFRSKVIEPFLKFFMKESRLFYKIIMYLVEVQSSITFTL